MSNCRKGQQRPIPFDCKHLPGHDGECSPYTLPPQGTRLDAAALPASVRHDERPRSETTTTSADISGQLAPGTGTQMPPTRLRFGYNAGLPEEVTVAWGARAILTPDHRVDLVHDRQSTIGSHPEIAALTDTLDAHVTTRWTSAASALLAAGVMHPRSREEFVLTRTDGVIVKANTLGSGGYLYVCAYPDVPEHGSIAWARAELDRLHREYDCLTTGQGFEAMNAVITQIQRPAFAPGQPVLAERDGGRVCTGRFAGEHTNHDGRPNGIVRVAIDARTWERRGGGYTLDIGLIMLTSATPTGTEHETEEHR